MSKLEFWDKTLHLRVVKGCVTINVPFYWCLPSKSTAVQSVKMSGWGRVWLQYKDKHCDKFELFPTLNQSKNPAHAFKKGKVSLWLANTTASGRPQILWSFLKCHKLRPEGHYSRQRAYERLPKEYLHYHNTRSRTVYLKATDLTHLQVVFLVEGETVQTVHLSWKTQIISTQSPHDPVDAKHFYFYCSPWPIWMLVYTFKNNEATCSDGPFTVPRFAWTVVCSLNRSTSIFIHRDHRMHLFQFAFEYLGWLHANRRKRCDIGRRFMMARGVRPTLTSLAGFKVALRHISIAREAWDKVSWPAILKNWAEKMHITKSLTVRCTRTATCRGKHRCHQCNEASGVRQTGRV